MSSTSTTRSSGGSSPSSSRTGPVAARARGRRDGRVDHRLGDELALRLPRRYGPEALDDAEARILAALASRLPVEIPRLSRTVPGAGYPWFWSVHTWLDGSASRGSLPVDGGRGSSGRCRRSTPAARRTRLRARPAARGARRTCETRSDGRRARSARAVGAGGRRPQWNGRAVRIPLRRRRAQRARPGGAARRGARLGGAGAGDPALDVMVAWKLVARKSASAFERCSTSTTRPGCARRAGRRPRR